MRCDYCNTFVTKRTGLPSIIITCCGVIGRAVSSASIVPSVFLFRVGIFMRFPVAFGLLLFGVLLTTTAREHQTLEGRVVDEKGAPVANASVDFFWRANGSTKDQNGKSINPETEDGNKLWWGRVGQMQPFRTA